MSRSRPRIIRKPEPMTDPYLRPGKILGTFSRLYPDAWKQVDEVRAKRKELGDWPEWCFLPLAGPTCYPPGSPGRHPGCFNSLSCDGGHSPACALISEGRIGTHSESASRSSPMPGR